MNHPILGECTLDHVCIVTHDLEKTKRNYAALVGAEVPESIVSNDYENMHTWFRGAPAPRSGLSQCGFRDAGGVTVELIMPDDGPSAWNDQLREHGDGLHHLAFLVKDLDAVVRRCEENGMPKVQTGDFPGGHYAYVDGRDFVEAYLELMELF